MRWLCLAGLLFLSACDQAEPAAPPEKAELPTPAVAPAQQKPAAEPANPGPKARLHVGDVVRFRSGVMVCKTRKAAVQEEDFGPDGLPSCFGVPPTEDLEILSVGYDQNDFATAQVRALATHGRPAWIHSLDDSYWERTGKKSIYD